MEFNEKNFPVKATPQEYEKWGKGFFKEIRQKIKKARHNERVWKKRYEEKGIDWHNQVSGEWRLLAFQFEEILNE